MKPCYLCRRLFEHVDRTAELCERCRPLLWPMLAELEQAAWAPAEPERKFA